MIIHNQELIKGTRPGLNSSALCPQDFVGQHEDRKVFVLSNDLEGHSL